MFGKTHSDSQDFNGTDPNCASYGDNGDYFYQERKIVELIVKNDLTPEKFRQLYLLVNIFLPDDKAIFKSIWQEIASLDYKTYKENESRFKQAIIKTNHEVEFSGSILYTSEQNSKIYIQASDSKNLSPTLIGVAWKNRQKWPVFKSHLKSSIFPQFPL